MQLKSDKNVNLLLLLTFEHFPLPNRHVEKTTCSLIVDVQENQSYEAN